MMRKMNGRYPEWHKHECLAEMQGQVMSSTELHDFAVQVLMAEYTDTGAEVTKVDKQIGNEADFCFRNTGKKPQFTGGGCAQPVNVLVVCSDELEIDISSIDTSWLEDEYKRSGILFRVTVAKPYYLQGENESEFAVCGGNFRFEYYSVSPLPGESNAPLEKELTDVQLAQVFAECWKYSDAKLVAPYLDKDFHYGSHWVFDELPSRVEFLSYYERKLEAISHSSSRVSTSVVRNRQNGRVGVLVKQGDEWLTMKLTTRDGRILSAHIDDLDWKYKTFDPEDELYQTHGDHIECIMPVSELMGNRLQDIMAKSKPWQICDTQVTTDDMYERRTSVFSLLYGEGDIHMLTTIARSRVKDENLFMSTYPIAQGTSLYVHIDKVIEWDNQVEATVLCSNGSFSFAFFAADYYCSKSKYVAGADLCVDIAAFGMNVEEAEHGFRFEGQVAIDWLAKLGQSPTYDENGEVEPVRFNTEHLVTFLNLDSKCPDEAEFQSPVGEVKTTSILGVDFFKTSVAISHGDEEAGESEMSVPLYFRQDFLPEVKVGTPIRGWMWLTGVLTGMHDVPNYGTYERPLGDVASEFEESVSGMDFKTFDNIMPVLQYLPQLKIRQGYELDAFQVGGHTGWTFRTYCRKANACVDYDPDKHGAYNDSLNIDGMVRGDVAKGVPDALPYFKVPFTEIGILQAWLLDHVTQFMPKGWHALYSWNRYIFEEERIDELFPEHVNPRVGLISSLQKGRSVVRSEVLAIERDLLLPSVTIHGDTALLEYSYWNDWNGLVKVRTEVVKNADSVRFLDSQCTLLVKFCSGIRF